MARVAPTFGQPTVTDTTVETSWSINGDTPFRVRIYTQPGLGFQSPFDEVDPSINHYIWRGLAPGRSYRFNVSCVYLAGGSEEKPAEEKANAFPAQTRSAADPPQQSIRVTDLRATQVGYAVRLDYFVPPGVETLQIARTGGQPFEAKVLLKIVPNLSDPAVGEYQWSTDSKVKVRTAYTYEVQSYEGNRVESAKVSITTDDPKFETVQNAIEGDAPRRRLGGG